jgi:hypothetical protein
VKDGKLCGDQESGTRGSSRIVFCDKTVVSKLARPKPVDQSLVGYGRPRLGFCHKDQGSWS